MLMSMVNVWIMRMRMEYSFMFMHVGMRLTFWISGQVFMLVKRMKRVFSSIQPSEE